MVTNVRTWLPRGDIVIVMGDLNAKEGFDNILLGLVMGKHFSNPKPFPEWKEGMTVKIPKKGIRFECENWKGMCVLTAVTKIIAKMTLEHIKEHLESLIVREQAGLRSESSCIHHINTLRMILRIVYYFAALAFHRFRESFRQRAQEVYLEFYT